MSNTNFADWREDEARLEELKRRVAAGTYQVPASEIANAMLYRVPSAEQTVRGLKTEAENLALDYRRVKSENADLHLALRCHCTAWGLLLLFLSCGFIGALIRTLIR